MKRSKILLPLLVLCILCCLALTLDIPAPLIRGGRSDAIPTGMQGGARPPGGGSCANTDRPYPDNPFSGWPVQRFLGDWKTISSWFCDPTYFRGFTHWGIDITARATATEWASIDGAEVFYTADLGVVTGAAADGGTHWGMGNHVIVNHVVCEQRCGWEGEETEEGQYIFLLEEDWADCLPPGSEGGFPPDLVLDCWKDAWRVSYFHLKTVFVGVGQLIVRGDALGQIDNTGNSTGPHLHYQINGPEGAIDPAPSMCEGYDPSLRQIWRWERPLCPDYEE